MLEGGGAAMTIPFLWVPVTALACYTVLLAALLPACTTVSYTHLTLPTTREV